MFIFHTYCPHSRCIHPQNWLLFLQGTNAYDTTSRFTQQKKLLYFRFICSTDGDAATLLLLPWKFSCDTDDPVVIFSRCYVSSSAILVQLTLLFICKANYFLHGFEPSDLTGFFGHERSKEFIISSTILDSCYRDTTTFYSRNWQFQSYRFIISQVYLRRTLRTFRILTAPNTSCFLLQH